MILKISLSILAILASIPWVNLPAQAQTLKDGVPRYVVVNVIPEKDAISPGETLTIAIEQNHQDEWHTYWKNPGDSGETTSVIWTLPEGFTAGEIDFPKPHRIAYGPLMNYGFSGKNILLTSITAPETITSGEVTLTADISWLVCKDICVPEFTKATLVLPIATAANLGQETDPDLFIAAKAAMPEKMVWQGMIEEQDQTLKLTFDADDTFIPELQKATDLFFYPEEWGILLNPAPQEIAVKNNRLEILVQRDTRPLSALRNLKGVLVYQTKEGQEKALALDVAISGGNMKAAALLPTTASPDNSDHEISGETVTIMQAIFLAILGGMILNLMPCVFPVLSMKALSLVKMSAKEQKYAAFHGFFYTAGILVCFGGIAAALIALKSAGEEIGWGFQLQNPVVVLLLAYLLFVMALNLSGFFEFKGHLFSNIGHKLAAKHGYSGTFFTGMLATIVATPCTAPFMGTAMGFALTQSPVVAMTVFLALGVGLALPYLVLCLVPSLRKALPKPGAWMETFRQFMAFPLYASVAWLVWVYAQQVSGNYGVMLALFGLIMIAFSVWIARHTPKHQPMKSAIHALSYSSLALALLIVALSAMKPSMVNGLENTVENALTNHHAYSTKGYEDALSGDKPIFINMTAAWCITCKWNERVALATEVTSKLFTDHEVIVFQGDWTNQNAEITEFLTKHGRSGVPLYVFIGARDPETGKRPEQQILPQILTPALVAEFVSGKRD
ncbi:MAG TPA: protein-disulfide reductase DsbD family protein [Alphaproteobacteria bacterium]|nr:protein-disulfide reductase DsbD family protein [Alphaproteobacteria bacterium]